MKQLLLELSPPPSPTLDNFVAGPNGETLAAVRAMLDGSAGERFLYLWGGRGCGKSHLAAGFVAACAERGLRVEKVAGGRQPLDAAELATRDAVVVDDVAALPESDQVALFDLINRLREGSGLLLATGPVAPMHLRLRPELATRLSQGLVYQVRCLSDADKQRALQTRAWQRGFTLGADVAAYLLRTWRRDLPSLMAVLDALDRYSLEVKRPITLPLVRDVLSRLVSDG